MVIVSMIAEAGHLLVRQARQEQEAPVVSAAVVAWHLAVVSPMPET